MTTINITEISHAYKLSEDGEMLCTHEDHTIEPPCCNGRDCGCYGQHSVYCNNPDCTGITDNEVDELIENYINNQERDYDEY